MKLSSAALPDKPETAPDAVPDMASVMLDLDRFLPFQLSVTANAVSELIASAYRSLFGLRVAEWRVLAIIAQSPGLISQAIGRRAELDKITVSRAVAALLARQLIVVAAHPSDRRSHRLQLSEAGEELYRAVVPAALALESRVVGSLSVEERAQLTALLDRVRDAARTTAV